MPNPIGLILDRCRGGLTAGQKWCWCAGLLAYVISPIDLIPDFILGLGQLDDLGAIVLIVRVLMSPTLPSGTIASRSKPSGQEGA